MHFLITRPQPDADDLAKTLKAMGHQCTISPLLELEYFTPQTLDLTNTQALIITSRNTVRALENKPGTTALLKRPLFVVGNNTATYASDLGFTDIRFIAENAEKLAAHIKDVSDPNAGRILYLTGEKRAFDMDAYLKMHNFQLNREILYQAAPVNDLTLSARKNISDGLVDGVILLSPLTAKIFSDLIAKNRLEDRQRPITHYCLSQNVANELADLAPTSIQISKKPNLPALLSLIRDNS